MYILTYIHTHFVIFTTYTHTQTPTHALLLSALCAWRDLPGCVAAEFGCTALHYHFLYFFLANFCSASKCIIIINFHELHVIKKEII